MSTSPIIQSSGRRLVRNILWNSIGTGAPFLAAVVAIPVLIDGIGAARFGVLTLAWMVVGYFSLFDLGLGRALTQLVAERLGAGRNLEIPPIVWTAMSLMGGLGVLAALVLLFASRWLVSNAMAVPEELHEETLAALRLLAVSVPIVISSTGLRGILEAHRRFGLVNAVRLPLGMITFLGPMAVLSVSTSLPDMVLVLVFARIVSWLAYLLICLNLYPELRQSPGFSRAMSRRLLSFGGWMTVSNITAPLLLYLGRIVIIFMISAEAVAYFVTPYEVVIRLLIIPGVLVAVLFPEFTLLFQQNMAKVWSLYKKAMVFLCIVMLPPAAILFVFAQSGLEWWINDEFSRNGYRVAQVLAVGVFINSFGHISQSLIQGFGRPDLTAKLHLAELAAYIPYLWLLIEHFGIVGAAYAWTIRVSISTVALAIMANWCLGNVVTTKH